MKLIYLITLILWAFGLVNLFEPFNGITFYLASIIFYGFLIAHLIECIVYRDKIIQSKDTPIIAFGMTILFGVIYLSSIKDS